MIQASDGFFYGTTEQGSYGGRSSAWTPPATHRDPPLRLVLRATVGGRAERLIEGATASSTEQPRSAANQSPRTVMESSTGWTKPAPSRSCTRSRGPTAPSRGPRSCTVRRQSLRLHRRRRSVRLGRAVPRRSPRLRSPPPTLTRLTLTPSSVVGGRARPERSRSAAQRHQAERIVTLERHLVRRLVAATVTVPAGATSASFAVSTEAGQANEDGDDQRRATTAAPSRRR